MRSLISTSTPARAPRTPARAAPGPAPRDGGRRRSARAARRCRRRCRRPPPPRRRSRPAGERAGGARPRGRGRDRGGQGQRRRVRLGMCGQNSFYGDTVPTRPRPTGWPAGRAAATRRRWPRHGPAGARDRHRRLRSRLPRRAAGSSGSRRAAAPCRRRGVLVRSWRATSTIPPARWRPRWPTARWPTPCSPPPRCRSPRWDSASACSPPTRRSGPPTPGEPVSTQRGLAHADRPAGAGRGHPRAVACPCPRRRGRCSTPRRP